jgi:hypothetical protein
MSFFAFFVTSVKTGVQNRLKYQCPWIPAFAGMTIHIHYDTGSAKGDTGGFDN